MPLFTVWLTLEYTHFFMRTSTLFEKATLITKMFLTPFKKAFLVFKFNFLFPKSLDILKEYNENASLSSKKVLNEKINPFLVLILVLNKK